MPVVVAAGPVSPSEVTALQGWDKLSTPAEFDAVFQARCASHGEFARVLARASAHPLPRLGITVSRKVCKTAVGRNYMKRVSRELFRRHVQALGGLDVVVLMRRKFQAQEYMKFCAEFDRHVERVQKCRNTCVSLSAPTSSL